VPDVSADEDPVPTGFEHAARQSCRRRLPFRARDRHDPAAEPSRSELEFPHDRNPRASGGLERRLLCRYAGAQDDEIRGHERRLAMAPELELYSGCPQPVFVIELWLQIGEGDAGASPDQQLRGRHTTPRGTDNGDLLATNREGVGGHRSFRVVRLNNAKMIATIRNRVMTFGSLQPISSKW
jgi:hypothetical protein